MNSQGGSMQRWKLQRTRGRGRTRKGGGWSWAAVLGVVLLLAAMYGTWGLSIFLWPVTLGLSAVAWFRSDRDGLFWLGVASNALLALFTIGFFYAA
jgi:hypothetical protein